MSKALSHMIDALGFEVSEIRNKGDVTRIELRDGERIGRAEGKWLYRFSFLGNRNLRDDTPVSVFCAHQENTGVLVSLHDGVLVVAIESDLGLKIASAHLVARKSFLLERLKERLERVRRGEEQFNKSSAERVIGESSIRAGDAEPQPVVLQGHDSLNDEQRVAIRRSLGSDTTFVWGPPGTGKTTTLARIVEAHYRAGRSVLLVSNTNVAVDKALEEVAERLMGEPDFHQGAVLRKGPVVNDELRRRFGPQVMLEEVVGRLGEALHLEKEDLQRQVAERVRDEHALTQAVAEHERFNHIRRALADVEEGLVAVRRTAQAREAEVKQLHLRTTALRANLERARSMGTLWRLFSGLNSDRLEREIAASDRFGQCARDAAHALAEEVKSREAKASQLKSESERLANSVSSCPAVPECRKQLEVVQEKRRLAKQRIAAIDSELVAIEGEVLGRCRILATTVYRTYLGGQNARTFDVVAIDEASMLMLPLAYYAAGLASQVVIVAGDFRQLPPIVISNGPEATEWLKQDVFEKAGIPEKIRERSATPDLVALSTQYRMREPICAVVNRFFYPDHTLHTAPFIERESSPFPWGEAPLLYVDTSPFHPWTARSPESYSRYNLFRALMMRNIVLHLAEVGYLPGAGINNAVGAVAPYREQSRLTQDLLKGRLKTRAAGIAATVHQFQGNQKSTIVLDITDSYGSPLSHYFKASRKEEEGARLLNVAVSRTQHHVILIANFDYLRTMAPTGSIIRPFIEHFVEHGESLDVKSLLLLADLDWEAPHSPQGSELTDGDAWVFTEETFYSAFAQDLVKAKSSIVVISPFATTRGTTRWFELLRGALKRGVVVRIVTRPPDEIGCAPSHEILEGLRALGAAVDLRARMHEKIAIFDGEVLWHGSLNILSHRDTHESMLRIQSPAACETLGRFLKRSNRAEA